MAIMNYQSTDLEKRARTVETVIEDLGYGAAQFKLLLLAGVASFCQGCQLCLLSVVATPITMELHLNHNQKALFSTVLFTGGLLGTIVSGQFGDMLGRRLPIGIGALVSGCVGCVTPVLYNYNLLLCARLALGIVLGVGFPASVAYLSEVTPKDWRIATRCLSCVLNDAGYSLAAAIATLHNPHLDDLPWRRVQLIGSIFCAAAGLVTVIFLQESPVYLAARGRHQEAEQVLDHMRTSNKADHISIKYHRKEEDRAPAKRTPQVSQFSIVFSEEYRGMVCVLCIISFTLNSFHYGGLYVQPQVMSGHRTTGALPAGVELIIGGPADGFGLVLVLLVAKRMPRLLVMAFAMLMAASVSICFGFAGQFQNRSLILEYVYQWGIFGYYWVPAVGFVILWQLAVEIFPTTASATGCSIAMAAGRLGALSAPLVFENVWSLFGKWNIYCYIIAFCCSGCYWLLMSVEFPGSGTRTSRVLSPQIAFAHQLTP